MKYRSRIYYSAEQKNLMWDRWQAGDSLNEIARLFDRGHSSVQGVLSETGGIRPRARSRSPLALGNLLPGAIFGQQEMLKFYCNDQNTGLYL